MRNSEIGSAGQGHGDRRRTVAASGVGLSGCAEPAYPRVEVVVGGAERARGRDACDGAVANRASAAASGSSVCRRRARSSARISTSSATVADACPIQPDAGQRAAQRGERQQHEVVPLAGVRVLVGEQGGQLRAVEQAERAGADDDARAQAGHAVGGGAGVVEHQRAGRGGVGAGDEREQVALALAGP